VAAKDTPVPYGPELENAMLPQEADVVRELEHLLRY
jgi:pyruvate/2-oxoglutarate/acetoin dehydrogenase E1 component